MARKFEELRARMSPAAREKSHRLAQRMRDESAVGGDVTESSLPEETRHAMRDVRNGNVTRCESLEQLFRELEI